MQYKLTPIASILIALFCSLSSLAFAEDTMRNAFIGKADKSIEGILGFAVSSGGDELGKVHLVNNSGDTSTESIEAGGLWYIYGGVQIATPAFPLRLTLGYFEDGVNAKNGSVSFSRIPVELLGVFSNGTHTVALGPTYHLSPKLDMDDAGYGSYEADDALGMVLMYEYTVSDRYALGVRYTSISYDFGGSENANGDNLGVMIEFKF